MTKTVAKKEETQMQVYTGTAWGAGTKVEAEEIVIPKLLMLQANAEMVVKKNSKFKGGDVVHSVDETLIRSQPDSKTPIELIIFDSFRTRAIYTQDGDQMKYVKSEPWKPEFRDRAAYPFEGMKVEGVLTKWRETKHFMGLTPQSIEEGRIFPFVVSMKGLSMKTSNKLSTIFANLASFNAPSAAIVIELFIDQETNDKGTFWVWRVAKGRYASEKEVTACKKWYETMATRNVVIDESSDKDEETAQPTGTYDPDQATRPTTSNAADTKTEAANI